ncbi:DUF3467 domain-containing protein [Arsenicitalea aurantiaca]|uniref:DUF3467 domain-containing protein n=1 Tax=Arsenicitalea aurantiaca TaxID=1783274 RepID=A0A433X884_9HYPH|nr:DUF3467 domain-containing protein [Arsenicitalea aurantiaca]RUT30260.1 DUF3467 domain-containing protein [Arsenicitalea aurantiaca]
MNETTIDALASANAGGENRGVNITWNDDNIESKYSNIATVTATREEFFFLFGTHQNWRGVEDGKSVEVQLSNRMVLSPYAAKRLLLILNQTVKAYEARFGEVKL